MEDWSQPTLQEGASQEVSLREVHYQDQLDARDNTIEILQESMADLELAFEDRGWDRLAVNATREFSPEGLRRARELCRVMTVANPLLKRGLGLRKAYVWGQGVTISVRDQSDEGQDVNAVVQDFLDDPFVQKTFSGTQAHEEMEQAAFTDGDLFCALFTSRLTGKVQPRWLPVDEITDIIHDPDDNIVHWYYRREYVERTIVGGMTRQAIRTVYYPALGYEPQLKPPTINGYDVQWDAPVRMVSVNRPSGSSRGVPDSFAAIAWARHYKEFLEQWATLMRALARYAWQTKTRGDRAKAVAAKIGTAPPLTRETIRDGNMAGAGSHVVSDPNTSLEAIPKTGATIDSDSGRPLAAMAATAMEVPVTMLLGDPGVTGARATAATLDQPTQLGFQLRQELWAELIRDILNHVIDWAIRAPKGKLQGTQQRDGDRILTELPDNDDRTIDISWPEFESLPVDVLVKAIAEASAWLPPLVVARLVAGALKIDNVDEVLSELTDEAGNFLPPDANAGQAAVDAFRKGQDPAALLNGDPQAPAPDVKPPVKKAVAKKPPKA
jgi:hypothetical protein